MVRCVSGYVELVRLFLETGATTALLNQHGALFTPRQFEGAIVLIEAYRNKHTAQVMKLVADKSKKAVAQLAKIFIVIVL